MPDGVIPVVAHAIFMGVKAMNDIKTHKQASGAYPLPCEIDQNGCLVYGGSGVCRLEDVQEMSVGDHAQLYYVLKPRDEEGATVYIPVDNAALTQRMRPILKKSDIDALLTGAKDNSIEWIENKTERGARFSEILRDGIKTDMILMLRCLHDKKVELLARRKTLASPDDAVMRAAEKLVEGEFAYVLSLSPKEVSSYIRGRVEPSAVQELA